jgi:hypothetical protein
LILGPFKLYQRSTIDRRISGASRQTQRGSSVLQRNSTLSLPTKPNTAMNSG